MDLSNKAISSLDEDLEVSSSDEEVEQRPPVNEEDLLKWSDDEAGRPNTHASWNLNFNLSTDAAAGPSKAQENMAQVVQLGPTRDTDVEDGEIEYPDTPNGVLTLNKSRHRPGFEDIDLDEICRQRNIHAPPRGNGQQNRRFLHDRVVAGARNKMFNIDPRENESLDDIIRRIPLVGLGRDHQTIRRRHHYGGGNGPQAAQQGLNEKLKKGVQSITEVHPEPAKPILEPLEQPPEGYPEYRDEPWQCILKLINKGLSMYWSLKKLKNPDENIIDQDESRLFRCLVSYNEIQGICEASTMMQAKHGAAVDLLGKLAREFPNLGRFPEKVNDAILIKQSVWGTLIKKLKEQHGGEYRFNDSNDKVNNRRLFKSVLFLDSSKYEGYSYMSGRAAKSMAIKMAYEDVLKEACPMDTIHLGLEQVTSDISHYRGVESHMIHCYDLSRSVVVDAKHVREQVKKSGGPHFPRRETCVPVSFVRPEGGPHI